MLRLVRGGKVVAEAPMEWGGEPSLYRGEIVAPAAGEWELQMIAMDPEDANFGMDARTLKIAGGGR